jgi:hypothetical protein
LLRAGHWQDKPDLDDILGESFSRGESQKAAGDQTRDHPIACQHECSPLPEWGLRLVVELGPSALG